MRLSIENANRVLIIKQLVSMLYDKGTAAQEQAAAALANLASDSADNRVSIVDAGGIEPLLALLESDSAKAKENSVLAITQLANNSLPNQTAMPPRAASVARHVLTTAASNIKEPEAAELCSLAASAVTRLCKNNAANQAAITDAGAITPLVAMLGSPNPQMQANASGALSALSRGSPDNQAAIARTGAIAPLCARESARARPADRSSSRSCGSARTSALALSHSRPWTRPAPRAADRADGRDRAAVRARARGLSETKEQSASALWSLSTDNAPNKATIAKLGGIEPLVGLLVGGGSEKSQNYAAGARVARVEARRESHVDRQAARGPALRENGGARGSRPLRTRHSPQTTLPARWPLLPLLCPRSAAPRPALV